MNEKVSVIMPCYNGEKHINQSVKSIYGQSYENIELIFVDDGSTDNSRETILFWEEELQKRGITLKYIYQKNKGLGGAINTGLKQVTGEFITLLDVDDEYLPDCIAERVEYLKSHSDVLIVRTNGYIVTGDEKRLFTDDSEEKSIKDVFSALLSWKTYNWAGSYMVRSKELFEFYPDRNIYESKDGQNLQLMLPLLYKRSCGYIDTPHMNYNRQPDSLSQASNIEEQKKKILSATEGYTDIRLYMIDLIVKTDSEKRALKQQVEYAKNRYLMTVAKTYNDRVLLCSTMKKLKGDKENRLDNRIVYYSVIAPPVSFGLRIIRKLKSSIKK